MPLDEDDLQLQHAPLRIQLVQPAASLVEPGHRLPPLGDDGCGSAVDEFLAVLGVRRHELGPGPPGTWWSPLPDHLVWLALHRGRSGCRRRAAGALPGTPVPQSPDLAAEGREAR